jgi:8-oxo-dGTP diphosphatase
MSTSAKRTIRVVAAEIRDDAGNYLITQRLPHASMPLLWEFPGGKVELGESDHDALVREIQEELAVTIAVGDLSVQLTRDYGHYVIDFHSYQAHVTQGVLQRIGVWDFRWVTPGEFGHYRFPPVDQESIDRLLGLDG